MNQGHFPHICGFLLEACSRWFGRVYVFLPLPSQRRRPRERPPARRGKTFVALGGARVEALWEEDLKWYPATIAKDPEKEKQKTPNPSIYIYIYNKQAFRAVVCGFH